MGLYSDNATSPMQATEVIQTIGTRAGWSKLAIVRYQAGLLEAYLPLVGWNPDTLDNLVASLLASDLPNRQKAAAYVQSLAGSNVDGVIVQTAQDVAKQVTTAAAVGKQAVKTATSPLFLLAALALGAAWVSVNVRR